MEKPNLETAISYIENGHYVWNSGMFIFSYETMINELKRYIPNHIKIIDELKNIVKLKVGLELTEVVRPYFERFERLSIDFDVMEKSQLIMCIPVDFGWNDVGGFNSLEEVFSKDKDLNIIKDAYYIQVDSFNNMIISDDNSKLITSIGVSNMIIVQTKHALLICHKDESQKIKTLLKKIV
jgi:mannose-1-phosphate guanylyltransferase